MNIQNSERRTQKRYSASSFSISLKPVNFQENIRPSTVDFNRFGMAIQSQQSLKIGDRLEIVISDEFNRSVEVISFVCNRAKTTTGYRCGLHFPDQNNNIKTKQSLIKMEQQL